MGTASAMSPALEESRRGASYLLRSGGRGSPQPLGASRRVPCPPPQLPGRRGLSDRLAVWVPRLSKGQTRVPALSLDCPVGVTSRTPQSLLFSFRVCEPFLGSLRAQVAPAGLGSRRHTGGAPAGAGALTGPATCVSPRRGQGLSSGGHGRRPQSRLPPTRERRRCVDPDFPRLPGPRPPLTEPPGKAPTPEAADGCGLGEAAA